MEKSKKLLSYNNFIKEQFGLKEHDDILIIVDVQKEFGDYIPKTMIKNLFDYCKEFEYVYQVWDSNQTKTPTFTFPNQTESIKKRFGTTFLPKEVQDKLKKLETDKKEGEFVILKDFDGQFVRVNNNHKWFLVNNDLIDFFGGLKNKNVILCGGADFECLTDFEVSAKAFGVNIAINHKFVYSAETKQN